GGFVDTAGYDLKQVEGSKHKTFKGKTIVGNLMISRDELLALVTDAKSGQRNKDFDYLLFTPARDKDYAFLYFDVKAVNNLQSMNDTSTSQVLNIRPCPPATWCRPKAAKTGKIINQ
ncbi:MAG: hypothetical protein ABIN25_01380, partial [Ginsengibacter sp.]